MLRRVSRSGRVIVKVHVPLEMRRQDDDSNRASSSSTRRARGYAGTENTVVESVSSGMNLVGVSEAAHRQASLALLIGTYWSFG
jgi:hypothetical protein